MSDNKCTSSLLIYATDACLCNSLGQNSFLPDEGWLLNSGRWSQTSFPRPVTRWTSTVKLLSGPDPRVHQPPWPIPPTPPHGHSIIFFFQISLSHSILWECLQWKKDRLGTCVINSWEKRTSRYYRRRISHTTATHFTPLSICPLWHTVSGALAMASEL